MEKCLAEDPCQKAKLTLRPTTLIALIQDYVSSLARHGFTQFLFLNGHGGNIASVEAAFSQIHAKVSLGRSPLAVTPSRNRNWAHKLISRMEDQAGP